MPNTITQLKIGTRGSKLALNTHQLSNFSRKVKTMGALFSVNSRIASCETKHDHERALKKLLLKDSTPPKDFALRVNEIPRQDCQAHEVTQKLSAQNEEENPKAALR